MSVAVAAAPHNAVAFGRPLISQSLARSESPQLCASANVTEIAAAKNHLEWTERAIVSYSNHVSLNRYGNVFPVIIILLIFGTTRASAETLLNSAYFQIKGYGSYSNVEYANSKRGVTVNEVKAKAGYAASVDLAVKLKGRLYIESGVGAATRNFDVRTTVSNQLITSRNSARLHFIPLQLRLLAGPVFFGGGGYYGRYASGATIGLKASTYGYMGSLGFFLTDDAATQRVVGSIGDFFKNKISARWFAEIRYMKDAANQAADPSETLQFGQLFAGIGLVF